MADAHNAATDDNGMDYAEHDRTFALFTTLVRNGAIAVVIILVLLAWFFL